MRTQFGPSVGVYVHGAGQWIQDDASVGGDLTKQWVVLSTYNRGPSVPQSPTDPTPQPGVMERRNLLQNAIGYRRLDGSEARYLVGWYGSYDSGDYWALPKGTPSPDGKVVVFDSEMNAAGRYDAFIAEVPLR